MRAALDEAGFTDTTTASLDLEWSVPDTDRYMDAILTGTVRAAAVLAAQSPDARAGVRAYIEDYLARLRTSAGAPRLPLPAIVGSGTRPG
jgi:hypothetical protein